jgi:hypothetical protein
MEPILNGSPVTIDLVTLTITTPATAINGGNVQLSIQLQEL